MTDQAPDATVERWVQMGPPEDSGDIHAHRLIAVIDAPVADSSCRWCNVPEPDWESPEVRAFVERSAASLARYRALHPATSEDGPHD